MPIVIGVVVFVVVLTATATAFWPKSIAPRADFRSTLVQSRSLSVEEILLTVDTTSLPVQEFEDRTFVFSSETDRSGDIRPAITAEVRR